MTCSNGQLAFCTPAEIRRYRRLATYSFDCGRNIAIAKALGTGPNVWFFIILLLINNLGYTYQICSLSEWQLR